MNKLYTLALIALCVVVGTATASAAGSGSTLLASKAAKTEAKSSATAPSNSFTQSNAWNKVGANLQQAYLAAEKAGFSDQSKLTCFVRADGPIADGDRSFLTSNGFVVQMASGFTARGQMSLKDLPSVAQLPFVKSINTAD